MIYATTKPIEEYVSADGSVGLYLSYGHRPSVLAFVLLFTHLGYDYESEYIKTEAGEISVALADTSLVEQSLTHLLNGVSIDLLLKTKSPVEVLHYLHDVPDEEIMEIPFIKNTKIFPDAISFKYLAAARVYVWMAGRKGVVSRQGNVTKVAFGGNSMGDIPELFLECHNAMMGVLQGLRKKS